MRSTPAKSGQEGEEGPQVRCVEEVEGGETVQYFYVGKYKYSSRDVLGKGFSSTVYKACPVARPKEKFAVKVIDLSQYDNIELLEMEIETLLKIRHPNVIECLDVIKTPRVYYLVMEYCPHGDLEELIRLQKCIPEDRAILILKQVLEGYRALLGKNIIHRDLKPANIMRFGNKWKIGDFGFARFCREEFLLEKIHVGTPLYMPLECLTLNKYSFKSDAFSLGVIFYEMLFGNTPWPAKTEAELVEALRACKRLDIPAGICEQSAAFLQRTLEIDYYTRITKDELKKTTFDDVNIEELIRTRPPKGMSPAIRRSTSRSHKNALGPRASSSQNLNPPPMAIRRNPHSEYGIRDNPRAGHSQSTSSLRTNTNGSSMTSQLHEQSVSDQYCISSPVSTQKPLSKHTSGGK